MQTAQTETVHQLCVSTHSEMKLGVVGVLVVAHTVARYDVGNRTAVDSEQQRSKYRVQTTEERRPIGQQLETDVDPF